MIRKFEEYIIFEVPEAELDRTKRLHRAVGEIRDNFFLIQEYKKYY